MIVLLLDECPGCDCASFRSMKYLIAEANYGGRLADAWDLRAGHVYIGELFCAKLINSNQFT